MGSEDGTDTPGRLYHNHGLSARVYFRDHSGREFHRAVMRLDLRTNRRLTDAEVVALAFQDDRLAGGGPITFIRIE